MIVIQITTYTLRYLLKNIFKNVLGAQEHKECDFQKSCFDLVESKVTQASYHSYTDLKTI